MGMNRSTTSLLGAVCTVTLFALTMGSAPQAQAPAAPAAPAAGRSGGAPQ